MKIEPNTVYEGDARHLAKLLPDDSISVTISSPPYWNLKDYGYRDQIGYGQSYEAYLEDLRAIFDEVYRATKRDGSLWLVLDTLRADGSLRLLPFEVASRLQKSRWKLQDVIIWDKQKTLPWSRERGLRNVFEYILCFSKQDTFKYEIDRVKELDLKEWWVRYPERYNPLGKVPSNIWRMPILVQGSWSQNGIRHACPFPFSLVERLIRLTTNPRLSNVVLDPFCGSGMVPATAEAMGRGFIGFELNHRFVQTYVKSVRPYVISQWAALQDQLRAIKHERNQLRVAIGKLRLLKFPRDLLQRLRKSQLASEQDIVAVLVAPENNRDIHAFEGRTTGLSSLIIIVVRNESDCESITSSVLALSSKPPLSKYGVRPTFVVSNLHSLDAELDRRGLSADRRLWSYQISHTHSFSHTMTLSDWRQSLDLAGDNVSSPAIVSTIRVQQEIKHTWRRKRSETKVGCSRAIL